MDVKEIAYFRNTCSFSDIYIRNLRVSNIHDKYNNYPINKECQTTPKLNHKSDYS